MTLPQLRSVSGRTALQENSTRELFQAFEIERFPQARQALKRIGPKADLCAQRAEDGATLLHRAIARYEDDEAQMLAADLIHRGLDPNTPRDSGATALQDAALKPTPMFRTLSQLCFSGARLSEAECAGDSAQSKFLREIRALWQYAAGEVIANVRRNNLGILGIVSRSLLREARSRLDKLEGASDEEFKLCYWRLLSALQPWSRIEAEKEYGGAKDKAKFLGNFRSFLNNLEVHHAISHLISVMPRGESFHPCLWKGKENVGINWTKHRSLSRWLHEELKLPALLLQASAEGNKVQENGPLRSWREMLQASGTEHSRESSPK